MSYNWKCCSFYPNNFDASALPRPEVRMYPDRGTHESRPRYACTPTEVRIRADRNEHTRRPKRGDLSATTTYHPLFKKGTALQSCAFFVLSKACSTEH